MLISLKVKSLIGSLSVRFNLSHKMHFFKFSTIDNLLYLKFIYRKFHVNSKLETQCLYRIIFITSSIINVQRLSTLNVVSTQYNFALVDTKLITAMAIRIRYIFLNVSIETGKVEKISDDVTYF